MVLQGVFPGQEGSPRKELSYVKTFKKYSGSMMRLWAESWVTSFGRLYINRAEESGEVNLVEKWRQGWT